MTNDRMLAFFDAVPTRRTPGTLDSAAVPYARVQQPGRVEYRVTASDRLPEGYRDGFVAVVGEPGERG